MIYQALARKWRPRTFDKVIGQEIVITCLKNALNSGKLHHAYLFTGSRGVGKTSIARIFAKSLNCKIGPTSEPCGQCINCQNFDNNSSVDLLEVDAASKTKVEDTRDLLNDVCYPPVEGRFKIYLIDEVHMLSGHSFNALLKTLEEPPVYVKFLFATTEPEKIPLTILSRCLVFNLQLVDETLIHEHLIDLLNHEKVDYEREAVTILAKNASGSIRDAISLLDQAITYGSITVDKVSRMLGWVDRNAVDHLLKALIKQDAKLVLEIVDGLYRKGCFLDKILDAILEKLYFLTLEQFDCTTSSNNALLVKDVSPETVQLLYQIALNGKRDLPFAPDFKIGLEMILLRMLYFQPVSIVKKTENLNDHANSVVTNLNVNTGLNQSKLPDLKEILKTDNLAINKNLLKNDKCIGIIETLVKHSCFFWDDVNSSLVCKIESSFFPLLTSRCQTIIKDALLELYPQIGKINYISSKGLFTLSSIEMKKEEERHNQRRIQLSKNHDLQNFLNAIDSEVIENYSK